MEPEAFFERLRARSRPRLRAAYREWMRQVRRMDAALALVSDLGLRWCLDGDPQWQAHRIEPCGPNQAVSFDARGRAGFVSVDLLEGGRPREVLTLSSFPPEVLATCLSPSRGKLPQSLEELLCRMVEDFPVLREVLTDVQVLQRRTVEQAMRQTLK